MDLQKIRVLLVDDHTMMRKGLYSLIHGRDGVIVLGEVSTGKEALQILRSSSLDVVVMDVLLQGENGIELSQQILS